MDRELEQYYEELFDLFARPGWKHLIEELQKGRAIYDDISSIQNEAELRIRQGRVLEIDFITAFPEYVQNAFEQMQEGDEDENV